MFLLVKTYKPQRKTVRQNRPFEQIEADKKARKKPVSVGKFKLSIRGIFLYPLIAVFVIALLAMVNNYQENLVVEGLNVSLVDSDKHPFLNEPAVLDLIDSTGGQGLVGKRMNDIKLKDLEDQLQANSVIKTAEVYKSMGGMLNIEVALRKPLARIVNNSGFYVYIDQDGKKFPATQHHSARVVLIRGDFEETVADTFVCETVEATIPLLHFIQNDEFWNAQISDVVVDNIGRITLYPQVGDMEIEFGYPDRIVEKFEAVKDFYEQWIPKVGWSNYRSVNVEYQGQLVAIKR